ncbi:MAG TPA: hypothetical protein VFI58_05160 [Xanthobacteraceae bacterium]|jgi:hypothetical protein|nr:hypothetical protein [Xanthobacteraceae bacterium]
MPVAPNTASSMIVRTATNPTYTIYNLGQNQILLGQDVITSGQLGSDFNFAGPGAVMWDFPQNTLDLWVSHPSTIVVGGSGGTTFSVPVTQFVVYNINGNTITNSNTLGNIGQDWQVQGFGYFFRSNDLGQADLLTRNVSNNTATYLAYDTENNQFNSFITAAVVGANFTTAGLGAYFTLSGSTLAQLMVLSDGAGGLRAYAYSNGTLVNDPSQVFATIGNGKDWEVLGFGHFNSQFGLTMVVRNIDSTSANFQQVWIYDVVQTATGNYAAQLSTAVTSGQMPGVLGGIGVDWKVAGIAPLNVDLFPANLVTDDLVMRNTNTGAFQVYNIQNDVLTGSAALTPPASKPIAPTSTVGGMAIDLSPQASGSTSQLVQAMAGFGDGSGAAGGLNAAPLAADSSQQSFLTAPQG